MKKQKIILAFILFLLGMTGVLSLLTMEFPIPPETMKVLQESLSPMQIKLVLLLNPTILLIIAILIGTFLYKKVNFQLPLIEKIAGIKDENSIPISDILKYGILGGILSGILLSVISQLFVPILPTEFTELSQAVKPTIANRFLYGGITEELLMRFGLMTLVVWICSKLFGHTKSSIYWIGILIAAFVFALGHLPIATQAVANPSTGLISFIIIGNSVGGIIFGWLYWKKGLESAMIAHIFAHVVMLLAEQLV